jgi:hypothetical protein
MTNPDDPRIGQHIEVQGNAYPAAAGPTVDGDDGTSYYLLGVPDWSPEMFGKRVVVTGTLRLRPPQVETLPPDQEQSHGLPDATLVIDDAQWTPGD